MNVPINYVVNCAFGWFITLLAVAGYFLTLKRMGQKWVFWVVLSIGWGFFALAYTLVVAGVPAGTPYLVAVWLCSYVLVALSIALLFLKLTNVKQQR